MAKQLTPEAITRLESESNIWFASTRIDGRPHLVPVWFVFHAGCIYICIEPGSVKGRNLKGQPQAALALQDGLHPVICEGLAETAPKPWPSEVAAIFKDKYDWDILAETQYTQLVRITPLKWLAW